MLVAPAAGAFLAEAFVEEAAPAEEAAADADLHRGHVSLTKRGSVGHAKRD